MKYDALLTNAVIFHNVLDIAEIVWQLLREGWAIEPEDLAHISHLALPDRAHQAPLASAKPPEPASGGSAS
ncbi:transposase [Streptomyces zagrosensis]|uniref:transposase n=1 Tax=Streptomyces zagrosensis TaxID=1042984 RepID=UPI001FEB8361|nr:transposase [Streptomyces zagrosensis]